LFTKGMIPLESCSASWRFFQEAMAPRAFGGLEAEKPAARQAGVLEELFDIIAVGKTPSVFPQAHDAGRDAQVGGDLFQQKILLTPPRLEDGCKVAAKTTPKP
jgi:hypothetical protein